MSESHQHPVADGAGDVVLSDNLSLLGVISFAGIGCQNCIIERTMCWNSDLWQAASQPKRDKP